MNDQSGRPLRVALAGQPNVGKSTVFNLLTGLNQHVGNWPGKTVEQKVGTCQHGDLSFELIDLPGTYSLSANSPEELIARDYIIREKPDVVVAVINAAALERSLYLVAELLPLPTPVIVGLNMVDVAAQEGSKLEPHVLEAALGVPVVPLVATRGEGICELLGRIQELACSREDYRPNVPDIRSDHKEVLERIESLVGDHVPEGYPPTWVALKVLEGDKPLAEFIRGRLHPEDWTEIQLILQQHEDAFVAVAGGRYEWIGRMVRAAVVRPRAGQVTLTDRLDRWATHPFWGLLILAGILGLAFWLTYSLGSPLQAIMHQHLVAGLSRSVGRLLAAAPPWLTGLVVDGIIGGVGTVVTFFPILVIFFAILGALEDVGYMARAAYVMDRFMHLMGLHGKSFLPLFLGFGCNVPAVMGTRVIDSERARLLTILLAPFVPCTARMAVVATLAPGFFSSPTLVSWGLVTVNLVALGLVGVALNRLVLRGEKVAFVMELPLFHIPNGRTIATIAWQRLVSFLQKAASVILIASVTIWLLSWIPNGTVETSLLAGFGRALEPLGRLMGLDWRMMVALLSSFVARENSLATLGILFAGAETSAPLTAMLRSQITPAAALAFLCVQMLFVPCAATVGAIRSETNSWRWTAFSVVVLLAVSLVGGILSYGLARALGF
jgi:ferrous iron transport protein B